MANLRFWNFLLLGFILFSFCKSAQKTTAGPSAPTTTTTTTTAMPTPAAAPPGDYASEWKTIDSLEQQGLFKSALERTEALYARAKKAGNGPQTVKTLLYRGKYTTFLEEDGFVKAVQTFESEEKSAAEPLRAVLQSLLGELYSTYLQNQYWRIQQRTPVADGEGGDLLTWSAAQLERKALEFYRSSVENEDQLRPVPVDYLRDISQPGQFDSIGTAPLRPNLFDFLGHRALEFFTNERSYLTEPAYKFYLDQPEAFAPAAEFTRFAFESRDSASGKWMAIRLFQRLIGAHLREGEAAPLIDADLLRLQFAKNNAVLEDRDERYRQALEILHKTHFNHPSDAEIVHHIAQALLELDGRKPGADAGVLQRVVADAEDAIRRHPGSYGAAQCAALLYELRRPHLDLEVELVHPPDRPMLLSVGFKNISKVWVKVVSVPHDPELFDQLEWENQLPYLNGRPALQLRTWTIPDPADFRFHRTELQLDPLPPGRYYVLASTSETFSQDGNFVSFAPFTCSNLAPVPYSTAGEQRFTVVHRSTGAPVAGVRGDCYETKWDRNQRKQVYRLVKQVQSDANGHLLPGTDLTQGYRMRFNLGPDTLWMEDSYRSYDPESRTPQNTIHFFTDRSLYRPGQTIYFKGILLQRDASRFPQIMPNQAVAVRFLDANHQEKARLQLRSNEFGAVNGTFQAPVSGLTGRMQILAEGFAGSAAFNVEEYKRPRFEVTFPPLEGACRVNDSVRVRGQARNYAGSNVDGAQVRYRVVREARFPWWDWWSWRKPFLTESVEIANGIARTDANGNFDIRFVALPDRSIPKKDQPMFDYQVYADVTDITGETRSGQTQITAGYVALNVDLILPRDIELDSLRGIAVRTTNTAGQFQAASGVVEIQRLVEPRQRFVKRYWADPDVLTLKEPDFRRSFRAFAWNGEDNPEKWDRQDFSRPVNFNTAENKTIDLHGGGMTAGYYQITLKTKDPFGEVIEIKRIVRVWTPNDRNTRFEQPSGTLEKTVCQPGETTRLWLGCRAERLKFLLIEERQGRPLPARWLDIAGAQAFDMAVDEADRGGFGMSAFTVKDNRLYAINRLFVQVPWSNKDLNINFETFRDKLAPGQKEEWRLRISGPKKERVAAELVAAMYDASLDQFLSHQWGGMEFPSFYPKLYFPDNNFRAQGSDNRNEPAPGIPQPAYRVYRVLNWFSFPLYGGGFPGMLRANVMYDTVLTFDPETYEEKVQIVRNDAAMAAPAAEGAMQKAAFAHDLNPDARYDLAAGGGVPGGSGGKPEAAPPPPPRRNLNETVFFFPEMRTDAEGNVVLAFTMNEALTRWKFLAFAHTRELQWALTEKSVVTQKELMILTNPPRFLREGDEIVFSAKVSNLSQEPISGMAALHLFDAVRMQAADDAFGLAAAAQRVAFNVQPGQSAPVSWRLRVPEGAVDGLTWQVFAEGNQFRDGEENTLPVLTNRMLVTEALPITVRGNQSKTVVFEHLKNNPSGTLRTQRYTIEFSSNPVWYAVQALPYLMEFPHECTEQIFSRFYANTLASSVTRKLPSLRRVYDRWKTSPTALASNLSKNQELKTALLEETPWVLDAQSEALQKQNIALLFDLNRMADEQDRTLALLAERQQESGGWPWFPGGRESWYITQHIVAGLGHLNKLGAFSVQDDSRATNMLDRAMGFCNRELQEQYRNLERAVQKGETTFEENHLDGLIIHYLYARSFFPLDRVDKITAYYLDQGAKYWLGRGLYEQGMMALALHRFQRPDGAGKIVASLRERALMKEELGMYWPFDWGMYWYQLPVETQALMVEVFDEVAADREAVEELRIWLLKNKQTNRWESTKATAEAVYALLLHGENWLENTRPVQVSIGGKNIQPAEYEPGTGYFKESWTGAEVKAGWSTVQVNNPNSNIVWGAAYWQYFEDMDKIQAFKKTPLTIVKQVFKEENTPAGPKLTALGSGNALHPGDKLKIRIEIRVDRAMEFVHLKDMRASGFEPVNVLSGYRWQDGLGYYESTKDLATHFFIDFLPRGTFVFEYPLVVNHRGDFSNGITTLQCMYAPEFTSHSAGIRLKVE